jgi:hypothetical protein
VKSRITVGWLSRGGASLLARLHLIGACITVFDIVVKDNIK